MHGRNTETGLRHLDFVILDILLLQLCLHCAFWINGYTGLIYLQREYLIQAMAFFMAQVALAMTADTYYHIITRDRFTEFQRMVVHLLESWFLAGFFFLLTGTQAAVRELFLGTMIYFDIDFFARAGLKKWHRKRGLPVRKVAVVTTSSLAKDALKRIRESVSSFDYQPECLILLDDDGTELGAFGIEAFRASDPGLIEKIGTKWIDDAFVLLDDEEQYPRELMTTFLIMGITIHSSLSVLDEFPFSKTSMQELGTFNVLTNSVNLVSYKAMFFKRAIDIAGGLAGCAITLLLTAVIGPLIYLKSPGPIFFKQKRIGRNGKYFNMYKFRSMYMDAEKRKAELMAKNKNNSSLMFKMDDDPRIIGSEKKGKDGKPKGIGNFIRNNSLDEFPQFFNVLKGDMSLVGTRPPTVDEWRQYAPHHRMRMSTKPGITGLWQVSGRSSITDFEEVIALDRKYIENWSVWLDIMILFRTVKVVLKHEGAS